LQHTDWKLLEDHGWFTAYHDDASKYILGYGLFPEATSKQSAEVLVSAIAKNGKPASVLIDYETRFANEAEEKIKGLTEFEKYLIPNEIIQILGRVMHLQINRKIQRFLRTVEEKLRRFESLGDLIEWYDMWRHHISLNLDMTETHYKAYLRKMPPE
jgi:transposase InsO family protein